MVYLEYNTSKKQYVDYWIDVEESNTQGDYVLLPFSNISDLQPNDNVVPSDKLHSVNGDNTTFVCRFKAPKTYLYGQYCLKYNDKYYLFTDRIKKGTKMYFGFVEYYDEGSEEAQIMPIIEAESYLQSKEILPVYDTLELNKSGSETTFSNVKADFGIRGMSQLPMAFQEIRIWQGELLDEGDILEGGDLSECELIYTGFLDKLSVTQKHNNDEECDLEVSLISPKTIATKRYVSINGTYDTNKLFKIIFEPLINDGFVLEEIDVSKKNVSVNYYLETIETVMNDLSNKLNLFWTIDSKKRIHIVDIIKLLGRNPKIKLDENDTIEGLYGLKPSIENTNYFNCINVKNARLYKSASGREILETMKFVKDETIDFINPIDFGINGCKRVCANNNTWNCNVLNIYGNDGDILYEITYEEGNNKIVLPQGVAYSDGDTEGASLILKRDNFFKNLITGIEWKGATRNIQNIATDTMLKYEIFRLTNSNEIYKCSQFLTDSGIIETTIDVNENWFTFNELVDYCNSIMSANSNNTASVEISLDKNYGFEIGDTIRINKPDFFIKGDFVITEIKEQLSRLDSYDCQIVAQNNKLQYNYIDIFRKNLKEENEVKYENLNVVEYVSDKIIETYGIYDGPIYDDNDDEEEFEYEDGDNNEDS